MRIALCSCWLLALCACSSGEVDGQGGGLPSNPQAECHPIGLDERGFRQSPRDVLEAFPSQHDVPLYWVDRKIEDPTVELEQSDVKNESKLSFELTYDDTKDIRECVTRERVCRAGKCMIGGVNTGFISVPVKAKLSTEDGVEAEFAMQLVGEAPAELYPITTPQLQWPHEVDVDDTYAPDPLSSDAKLGQPGFGEFAISTVGYTFLGRFYDSEHGLALFPTPCGGQLQVSPTELVLGQVESTASMFDSVGVRELANADDPAMPNVTIELATDDMTACYDALGRYYVDVHVTVATDNTTFDAVTKVVGRFGTESLAAWEGVCGDISGSAAWSALFDDPTGEQICVAAELQRTEAGIALAAEVSTLDATSAGFRVSYGYQQAQ